MSTVKIRAGSLFRTSMARIGAAGAVFRTVGARFPKPSTDRFRVHRMYTGGQAFRLARNRPSGAKSKQRILVEVEVTQVIRTQVIKAQVIKAEVSKAPSEVCPLCEGTGWKSVSAGPKARPGSKNDRRVTRCDCQLRGADPVADGCGAHPAPV